MRGLASTIEQRLEVYKKKVHKVVNEGCWFYLLRSNNRIKYFVIAMRIEEYDRSTLKPLNSIKLISIIYSR